MYAVLSISPQGHLYVNQSLIQADAHQAISDKKIINAFLNSRSEGLLSLLNASNTSNWPSALQYWRSFATQYFNQLCQQTSLPPFNDIAAPDAAVLDRLCLELPPIPGAEYCTSAALKEMWLELDRWVQGKLATAEEGLAGFLKQYLPKWHQVGRVCFHLAENKNDADYPFAFIATYAPSIGANARVQYQPLSRALQEYAGEGNKQQLLKLLKPVYEASQKTAWVKSLLASHDLYHPLAWRPNEAYRLLQDVPLLEESGLVVRLPDWWQKRPRPRVNVSIGSLKQSSFGTDAMLDFNVDLAIDGEALSQEELHALLSAEDRLISLRGKWVEVDQDKLKEALDHWKSVQAEAKNGGLTFIEGMRLLSGADQSLSGNDATIDENDSWAYVSAGGWLKDLLEKLRAPEAIASKTPGKHLNAILRPYQVTGANWLGFFIRAKARRLSCR